MRIVDRYVSSQVVGAVIFALIAFLSLFAFFDLVAELPLVGRGGYRLQHAFAYVALGFPGYVYDLMPIAALIGTIYALAQLAARSEFTIMRVSGLSTLRAGWLLAKIGLVFVVITFFVGEVLAPAASAMAERVKLQAQGASVSSDFRTGLWTKDVIRKDGLAGEVIGSRIINVRDVSSNGQLQGMRMYEFDQEFQLNATVSAEYADYVGANRWNLVNVTEAKIDAKTVDFTAKVITEKFAQRELISEITPDILSVLFADPDRMSAVGLARFTRHLAENNQNVERYEIAFWKKVIYPLAVFVMMALALPFAYLHFRSGGVSLKIFIGVMIGISFQLINSLFSHIGLLNTWPPLTTAALPSVIFLLLAVVAIARLQR